MENLNMKRGMNMRNPRLRMKVEDGITTYYMRMHTKQGMGNFYINTSPYKTISEFVQDQLSSKFMNEEQLIACLLDMIIYHDDREGRRAIGNQINRLLYISTEIE